MAWPLPRGPSPQISSLPAERLGWRSTTPSQLKVPAPSTGLAPAQEAWVPSACALPGCPSPAPLQAGRRRRALRIPHAPGPRAVCRLAQGAGFLEEIRRKSAGPLASSSPPNPAGARSSAAPLAAPGEVWKRGAGPSVLPFLLRELGWGATRVQHLGRRPLAQRPPISISSPPPVWGPRASHSWTSRSWRRREQRRLVGDRWGTTS